MVCVIVTSNMFGDIITDLGAMVQGGMGIAAGGNINPDGTSMFEPIGGSAPKYTGLNVINPLAAIEAGRMMLKHLGEPEAAKSIEKAVAFACTKVKSLSAGKMGHGTKEIYPLSCVLKIGRIKRSRKKNGIQGRRIAKGNDSASVTSSASSGGNL